MLFHSPARRPGLLRQDSSLPEPGWEGVRLPRDGRAAITGVGDREEGRGQSQRLWVAHRVRSLRSAFAVPAIPAVSTRCSSCGPVVREALQVQDEHGWGRAHEVRPPYSANLAVTPTTEPSVFFVQRLRSRRICQQLVQRGRAHRDLKDVRV